MRGGAVHGSVGGSVVSMPWNGEPGAGLLHFYVSYPDADDAEFAELVYEIEYEEEEETSGPIVLGIPGQSGGGPASLLQERAAGLQTARRALEIPA